MIFQQSRKSVCCFSVWNTLRFCRPLKNSVVSLLTGRGRKLNRWRGWRLWTPGYNHMQPNLRARIVWVIRRDTLSLSHTAGCKSERLGACFMRRYTRGQFTVHDVYCGPLTSRSIMGSICVAAVSSVAAETRSGRHDGGNSGWDMALWPTNWAERPAGYQFVSIRWGDACQAEIKGVSIPSRKWIHLVSWDVVLFFNESLKHVFPAFGSQNDGTNSCLWCNSLMCTDYTDPWFKGPTLHPF